LLAGLRFDEELSKALSACNVFLAVIGPRWMDLLKTKTSSDDRDYVREEIAEALRRKIVVIPVRVGREGQLPPLPRALELPPDIRDLVHYQKHDVTYEHLHRDASALANAVTTVRRHVRVRRLPLSWIGATAASVLAIGWVGAHQMGAPVWWPFGGDAKPALEPSKDDLASAAVLKEQAATAEQRRLNEAEAKRKAEEQARAEAKGKAKEAEQKRIALPKAEVDRQRSAEATRNLRLQRCLSRLSQVSMLRPQSDPSFCVFGHVRLPSRSGRDAALPSTVKVCQGTKSLPR
jgi:hypothetical protein